MRSLVVLLFLAGCNIAQQNPGAVQCQGKATLSANGALSMFGGGNGMVQFDCGPGAYIRQGADVSGAPDPVIPPKPSPSPPPPPLPPSPTPAPIVPPHRPPIPPAAPTPLSSMGPQRLLIPLIATKPEASCVPGWTATAWVDEPLTLHCR